MNNFGVIELAGARTTAAPGWAYVPDLGAGPGSAALQPSNRKRARKTPGGTNIGDLTARQEAKIRKEVENLDRDGAKDGSIPLPVRAGAQSKHTANVRKILQSQKTFGNHLDDFLALQALADNVANAANGPSKPGNSTASSNKRPTLNKKDGSTNASATPSGRQSEDIVMADADTNTSADVPPLLPPPFKTAIASHAGDNDPLLVSRVPDLPSDDQLRELLSQPPLTYGAAGGTWHEKYPTRTFCQVCGYWGRVRCMKCGTRVCALECLETHREECVTRYGL